MSEPKVKPSAMEIKAWLQSADIVELDRETVEVELETPNGDPEHIFVTATYILDAEERRESFAEGAVADATYERGVLTLMNTEGYKCPFEVFSKTKLELYIFRDGARYLPSELNPAPWEQRRFKRISDLQQCIDEWVPDSAMPALIIGAGLMNEQEYLALFDQYMSETVITKIIAPWRREIRADEPEHPIALRLENAIESGEVKRTAFASMVEAAGTLDPEHFHAIWS